MPESLYTKEMKAYIHGQSWPRHLKWEVVEYEGENLQFVLFRNNFNALTGSDKVHVFDLVNTVLEKIRADGVPIYLEVAADHDPGT